MRNSHQYAAPRNNLRPYFFFFYKCQIKSFINNTLSIRATFLTFTISSAQDVLTFNLNPQTTIQKMLMASGNRLNRNRRNRLNSMFNLIEIHVMRLMGNQHRHTYPLTSPSNRTKGRLIQQRFHLLLACFLFTCIHFKLLVRKAE